jgi:2-keto-4-pentenoate hydratase/2-oxohepta-3-ene-1,7-dioic acid hydratase in catechol pathway
MKYYRVETASGPVWAREEGEHLRLLRGDPLTGVEDRDDRLPRASARLLAPVTPSKIVAIGRNYRDHAAERNKPVPAEPLLFLKPTTALIGPEQPIVRPSWAGRIDYEAEMGVVIGKTARQLASPEAARDHVLGAVCVNDVTARELQDKDVQFTRAKGFDTFCPVGPCLATGLDLGRLRVLGRVNGQVRQDSRTDQLIFPVPYLVWFISRVMTLLPGDIISTGTPSGIGPLQGGDVVEVEVEGVGVLRNPVEDSVPARPETES